MSFNGSFGEGMIENSNVILTEEEMNNNNNKNIQMEMPQDINNLSFEALNKIDDNNNNISNEVINENNEIFNSIPMEIETEENDRNNYYQNEYLIENINYHLNKMIKTINKKFQLKKLFAFLKIKKISDINHYNIIEAELLYIKISNTLKFLLRIYKRKKKDTLKKYFFKWNYFHILNKQNEQIKKKIESKIQKENEEKINSLNKVLNDLEKNSNSLKKNYSTIESSNNDLKNKIKQFEEKENNLKLKIKQLQKQNNKFKEKISTRTPSISSSSENKTLESRKKLLESQINKLQDQKREKENTIQNFISEMEKYLLKYEQQRNYFLFNLLFFS